MKSAKDTKRRVGEPKDGEKPPLGRNLHPSQAERLVVAWEEIGKQLGEWNELVRTAIGKQWPEASERREAIVSRVPTAEDKLKAQTGNTDGPLEDWLGEFDPEEEIGPREREFLERQAKGKPAPRPKTSPKTS